MANISYTLIQAEECFLINIGSGSVQGKKETCLKNVMGK